MNCKIIADLIPLYVDNICSEESKQLVTSHITDCRECAALYEKMREPINNENTRHEYSINQAFTLIHQRWAALLQTIIFMVSFAAIILGVSLEAATPYGQNNNNGYYAISIVVPAAAFLLTSINFFFIREYRSARQFQIFSGFLTAFTALCAYLWMIFIHYKCEPISSSAVFIGIVASIVLCVAAVWISKLYAGWVGKK